MRSTLLLSISLCLLLAACGDSTTQTPQDKIKIVLSAIESGVESRSLSQVMEHISDDYRDHKGNDKKAVARLLQLQILRNQNINIFTVIKSLEVNGNNASVELSSALAAKEVDLSIESNRLRADAHRFSILLSIQDDQWKIQSVSW